MARSRSLDAAFNGAKLWREEALHLREILLRCGLREELKWGKPCYSYDGDNVCIVQRMKGFLALLFFKGGLLPDPDGILEAQGPHSRGGYRIRFTDVRDVESKAASVERCVREAVRAAAEGRKFGAATAPDYPDELIDAFDRDPDFRTAFEALTPGRQRGYLIFFTGAKQTETRARRIESHRRRVMAGKGMHDR